MKILILLMLFSTSLFASFESTNSELRHLEQEMSWETEKLYWMLGDKLRNDSENSTFWAFLPRSIVLREVPFSRYTAVYKNKRKTSLGIF